MVSVGETLRSRFDKRRVRSPANDRRRQVRYRYMFISGLNVQSTNDPKNTVPIGDDCDEKAVFPVSAYRLSWSSLCPQRGEGRAAVRRSAPYAEVTWSIRCDSINPLSLSPVLCLVMIHDDCSSLLAPLSSTSPGWSFPQFIRTTGFSKDPQQIGHEVSSAGPARRSGNAFLTRRH